MQSMLHRITEPVVDRDVRHWLHVVAPHVGFDECVTGAVEALSVGLVLASFPCTKCGATHVDVGKMATKPHTGHVCMVCGHKWQRVP